ncbi:MAG: TauD/TfdA family dioxygenase [Algicola sp.]|nr:TauD/TfdA family dioxygenase [Algicola sp.]
MKPLPDSAILTVAENTVGQLLAAAEQLPQYANRDFYDPQIQLKVYYHIRNRCQPEFDEVVQQIKACLQRPPFGVLIRGLQFDEHYRVFVALNRALGLMVARPYDEKTARAQLIHHVQPQSDINNKAKAIKSGPKLSEKLHIDAADRPTPVRFVSMQCVRADPDGEGRSRILDSQGFRAILASQPDMIKQLEREPVPWPIVDYLGSGVHWRTVLKDDCVFWRHYSINQALARPNVELAGDMRQLLDQVATLLDEDVQQQFDFLLAPGDLLIVDNHRCLHARTAINNPNTPRLMLRSWVE